MIKRRDVLKMSAAGVFGIAMANVGGAMSGSASTIRPSTD
jgi:hypothetical protein